MGGGLGGGSADAAFALKMMAAKSDWSENDPRLQMMASALGSDCSFFLKNSPMVGTGRGEILEPIKLDLSNYRFEFVFPEIQISTKTAFSKVKPKRPAHSIREIISQPVESWKNDLKNDFEVSVFEEFPVLAEIKDGFYEKGAVYASMSGSGSTIYGLFRV